MYTAGNVIQISLQHLLLSNEWQSVVKNTTEKEKQRSAQKETGYQGDRPETQEDITFTKTADITLKKHSTHLNTE